MPEGAVGVVFAIAVADPERAKGAATSSKGKGTMIIGVDTLPPLPTDAGDRNRTSPLRSPATGLSSGPRVPGRPSPCR